VLSLNLLLVNQHKKTWSTGKVELFKADTSKYFTAMMKFDNKGLDFNKVVDILKDLGNYRLSPQGRTEIEAKVGQNMGKRNSWEKYAKGGRLNEAEVENLRRQYIK